MTVSIEYIKATHSVIPIRHKDNWAYGADPNESQTIWSSQTSAQDTGSFIPANSESRQSITTPKHCVALSNLSFDGPQGGRNSADDLHLHIKWNPNELDFTTEERESVVIEGHYEGAPTSLDFTFHGSTSSFKDNENTTVAIPIQISTVNRGGAQQPFGLCGKFSWKLIASSTKKEINIEEKTLLEVYFIHPNTLDAPFWHGYAVPIDFLRHFVLSYTGKNDTNFARHVVEYAFSEFGFKYGRSNGGSPAFTGYLGGNFWMESFLEEAAKGKYWERDLARNRGQVSVNCYDMAAIVQVALSFVQGDTSNQWIYAQVYGYIKPTKLIGFEGLCNSPYWNREESMEAKKSLLVNLDSDGAPSEYRTGFGNHAFLMDKKSQDAINDTVNPPKIYDACAKPHIGDQTLKDYLDDAIDTETPLNWKEHWKIAKCRPKWVKKESDLPLTYDKRGENNTSGYKRIYVARGVGRLVRDEFDPKYQKIADPKWVWDEHMSTACHICCDFQALASLLKQDPTGDQYLHKHCTEIHWTVPIEGKKLSYVVEIEVHKDADSAKLAMDHYLSNHSGDIDQVYVDASGTAQALGHGTMVSKIKGHSLLWLHGPAFTAIEAIVYDPEFGDEAEKEIEKLGKTIDDFFNQSHTTKEVCEKMRPEVECADIDEYTDEETPKEMVVGEVFKFTVKGKDIGKTGFYTENGRILDLAIEETGETERTFHLRAGFVGDEKVTLRFAHTCSLQPTTKIFFVKITEKN